MFQPVNSFDTPPAKRAGGAPTALIFSKNSHLASFVKRIVTKLAKWLHATRTRAELQVKQMLGPRLRRGGMKMLVWESNVIPCSGNSWRWLNSEFLRLGFWIFQWIAENEKFMKRIQLLWRMRANDWWEYIWKQSFALILQSQLYTAHENSVACDSVDENSKFDES